MILFAFWRRSPCFIKERQAFPLPSNNAGSSGGNTTKTMMFVEWEEGSILFFLKNHTPFDNNSVADGNCFHLWCRPYLVANCDLFKIRTFPWSPSKVELGTFYLFTLKVGSKYTYIILEALVWSQQSSFQFNFPLWVTITWVTLAKSHQLKGLCHAICCLLKN